jgi:membrane protein YqaA with SNARE-associated domain
MDFFTGLGLFGLFLGSFLAGSIVPFSSEVLLGSALLAGVDPVACLISTSLGNTLGGNELLLYRAFGQNRMDDQIPESKRNHFT